MEEHIWFYGRLKGVSAAATGAEQEHLIRDVGLIPKRDTQTRHLSGELAFRGPLHGGEGCRTSGSDWSTGVHSGGEGPSLSPVAINSIGGFLPHLRSFCFKMKVTNLYIYNKP